MNEGKKKLNENQYFEEKNSTTFFHMTLYDCDYFQLHFLCVPILNKFLVNLKKWKTEEIILGSPFKKKIKKKKTTTAGH